MIEGFSPKNDPRLLRKADALTPELIHTRVHPARAFSNVSEGETLAPESLPELALHKGDQICLDFGTYLVGRVTLSLDFQGSHPDAPAWLELVFAETPRELNENTDSYDGWVSGSWIQKERVHVDVLPAELSLPYSFMNNAQEAAIHTAPGHCCNQEIYEVISGCVDLFETGQETAMPDFTYYPLIYLVNTSLALSFHMKRQSQVSTSDSLASPSQ